MLVTFFFKHFSSFSFLNEILAIEFLLRSSKSSASSIKQNNDMLSNSFAEFAKKFIAKCDKPKK